MKAKIILIILMVALVFQANAQKSYAEKAQSKKTTGYILLASGAAMITVALAADLSSDSPSWLVAGGLSTLASIPFFVSASKNKKKAGMVNGHLEIQRISPNLGASPPGMVPSLKLQISL